MWHTVTLEIATPGKGLHDITAQIQAQVEASGVQVGVCFVFVPHTSASLVLNENWDPTARADLEEAFERLVPPGQPWFRHTLEGADDMPAHIRAALTLPVVPIPIAQGRLALGTWQGVYLFEHRARPHRRRVLVWIWGEGHTSGPG
ncbi:MAG TPA: YjbQ family protein [Anaerolineae bacterium]|nr:YjbQ family protein [Anaerolineae bacterium]HID84492.1 YjbQ family protein [Anaerolineales bacterium]HIQ08730.1 YjbQ family protein [Anaerolineaceae bacterium]